MIWFKINLIIEYRLQNIHAGVEQFFSRFKNHLKKKNNYQTNELQNLTGKKMFY